MASNKILLQGKCISPTSDDRVPDSKNYFGPYCLPVSLQENEWEITLFRGFYSFIYFIFVTGKKLVFEDWLTWISTFISQQFKLSRFQLTQHKLRRIMISLQDCFKCKIRSFLWKHLVQCIALSTMFGYCVCVCTHVCLHVHHCIHVIQKIF